MAIVTQLWLLCFGLIIFTLGFFAAHSTASSWISRIAQSQRAVAASLYLFSYYLGSSLLGSGGGLIWEATGWIGLTCMISIVIVFGIILASNLQDIRD